MSGLSRRRIREIALQAAYEIEIGGSDLMKVLNRYIKDEDLDMPRRTFFKALVRGTWRYKEYIDEIIGKLSLGWKLDRIAKIDLNILRMAIFESLIGIKNEDITDAIIINEAVILAKKFSGKDAGKFVNGILATLIKEKIKWQGFLKGRRKEAAKD